MFVSLPPGDPRDNLLLAALPDAEYETLLPRLQPVHLNFKEVLRHAHEPVTHVYFPATA